jgi:hypothetical protein
MWTQRNQRSKELEIDLDELETNGNFTTGVLADRLWQQAEHPQANKSQQNKSISTTNFAVINPTNLIPR